MGAMVKPPHRWTEKERAWARAYAKHGNKARAVREAGYDVDPQDVGLHASMGNEIAARPHVAVWIEQVHRDVAERYAITPENILAELAKIAFANIGDYYKLDPNGQPYLDMSDAAEHQLAAVNSVQIKRKRRFESDEEWEVEEVKLSLHPKAHALELLGKNKKLFAEQIDITHATAMAERITQSRQRARLVERNDVEDAGEDGDPGQSAAWPDDGRAVRGGVQDGDGD